jgi:hypothetical protein
MATTKEFTEVIGIYLKESITWHVKNKKHFYAEVRIMCKDDGTIIVWMSPDEYMKLHPYLTAAGMKADVSHDPHYFYIVLDDEHIEMVD